MSYGTLRRELAEKNERISSLEAQEGEITQVALDFFESLTTRSVEHLEEYASRRRLDRGFRGCCIGFLFAPAFFAEMFVVCIFV